MPLAVGVSFRMAGEVFTFDPAGIELREGDFVIVETDRGVELGQVMIEPREVPDEEIGEPLKPITRKATDDDLRREEENRTREREAFREGQRRIEKHGLPMKLVEVEYTFDGRRIIFHFSAEGRVDFRKLVRDLASHFRARIELHQVGVRDEAKMIGGIGPCGRPLCCSTFLSRFEPVTIKMAKEQNLSLNPLKISGLCGRLMCCLNYENAFYRDAKQGLPKIGAQVPTDRGEGRVVELRVPKGTYVVALPEGGHLEMCRGRPCCARAGAAAPPYQPPAEAAPPEPPQPARTREPAQRPPRERSRPAQGESSGRTESSAPAPDQQQPKPARPRRRRRRRPRRPSGQPPSSGQQSG